MRIDEIREALKRADRARRELELLRSRHGAEIAQCLREAWPEWWRGDDPSARYHKENHDAQINAMASWMVENAPRVRDALEPFDGRNHD